jgi:hypothetical protein
MRDAMTGPRSASIILYCLGMSAIVVVLGFGFLRSTMRDLGAGAAAEQRLLAESAARAGVTEATEAILADYLAASLDVGTGAGTTAPLANPPTFLDGPYRASFVSANRPDRVRYVDDNGAASLDNVPAEAMTLNPMMRLMDHNSGGQTTMRWFWHTSGNVLYDGRGRYVEPNYHASLLAADRAAPSGASPVPVAITRFTDDTAAPTVHNGLFLDAELRRITSDGTATGDRTARLASRFRLRYALGVIDLGGHLLSNPKADIDADWSNASNEYRTPADGLRNAAEAWYNMACGFPNYPTYSDHITQPLRFQHVFQGRGNTLNYDRSPTTSLPVTFPYMFRSRDIGLGQWGRYADNFGSYGFSSLADYQLQLSYTNAGTSYSNSETKGLYRYGSCTATQVGGQALPNMYTDYLFAHVGPQPSWYTQQQSVKGFMDNYDACYYPGEHAPPLEMAMLLPTPFGRGLTAVSPWSGAASHRWYEARITTPWYVNVLTAPPRAISCMLLAYLPPSLKKLHLTEENFSLAASKGTLMLGTWNTIAKDRVGMRGHDLFTRLAGPAFSEWPTPNADGVDPNFQATDARTEDQKYPGTMWNEVGIDNLGALIDSNSRLSGTCSHTGIGLVNGFWNTIEGLKSWNGYVSAPPGGWGAASDWYFQRIGTTGSASYWWDILQAASSAIGVVRAEWVQYPNTVITPATAFPSASLRNPADFDSIKELDRLFLRQLGENYLTPGDGTPLKPIVQDTSGASQTISESATAISHTIKTLVAGDLIKTGTYTSAQRGMVMERVLNDFRLSFFGASPQYTDLFRPLDFDGDGKVMCSCYDSQDPTGAAGEKPLAIDRWKAVDGAFTDPDLPGTTGRGPAPDDWFCIAGTFYIGKSHHYRIICRGELFDNISQRPVADATLESVLVVDPDGNDAKKSHVLFQRWHHDRSTGHLSLIER